MMLDHFSCCYKYQSQFQLGNKITLSDIEEVHNRKQPVVTFKTCLRKPVKISNVCYQKIFIFLAFSIELFLLFIYIQNIVILTRGLKQNNFDFQYDFNSFLM